MKSKTRGKARIAVHVLEGTEGYSVCFDAPGTYRFRASIGSWSQEIRVEAIQVPVVIGSTAQNLVKEFGPPDKKKTDGVQEAWVYKRWPGLHIVVDDGLIDGIYVEKKGEPKNARPAP